MLIISLSTIPSRFKLLGPTLQSMLQQDIKIDAIELFIPKTYRRFPDYNQILPRVPKGVTINVVEFDFGPATKILPAVQKYNDKDVNILYCDDDRICPPNWARSFMEARATHPNDAIASCGWEINQLHIKYKALKQPRAKLMRSRWDLPYRLRRLGQAILELKTGDKRPKPRRSRNFLRGGYIDIMEGYGGGLIKPTMFDAPSFQIPNDFWSVDDIWLSGCLARQGIGIWANRYGIVPEEQLDITDALYQSVINGLDRQQTNLACAQHMQKEFSIWS